MRPLLVSKKRLSDRVLCFKVDPFIVRNTAPIAAGDDAESATHFHTGDLRALMYTTTNRRRGWTLTDLRDSDCPVIFASAEKSSLISAVSIGDFRSNKMDWYCGKKSKR